MKNPILSRKANPIDDSRPIISIETAEGERFFQVPNELLDYISSVELKIEQAAKVCEAKAITGPLDQELTCMELAKLIRKL
jgi:hypothetical protein